MGVDKNLEAHALALAEEEWGEEPQPLAAAFREIVDRTIFPAGEPARLWYVVRAEPQDEGGAAAGLIGRGFEAYVPTIARSEPTGHRRPGAPDRRLYHLVQRPMFPGYLFVRLSLSFDRWRRVFAIAGVRGFLFVDGAPAPMPDEAIQAIRTAEADLARPPAKGEGIAGHGFSIGDMVEIKEGAFRQFTAAIVRLDDATRITLLLSIFGRETKVIVSAGEIAKAG